MTIATLAMESIDEPRLESDTDYRVGYLTKFMGFGPDDVQAIHDSAAHLAPLVPSLVDAVYLKLFAFDATKRHFLSRNAGYSGALPVTLFDLTLDHPQIAMRKQHLSAYLVRLVTGAYDSKMNAYLDMVGKIHTNKAGNPGVVICLVQMNALMGFVNDALVATLLTLNLPCEQKVKMVRAFGKLLWIQNDLISRHYTV